MVPWSRGRDFGDDEAWDRESIDRFAPGARSALFLNILTEDNLPHYYRAISGKFGNDDVWGEWDRRWTAEEGRHAIVIRDYLAVTRSVDMRELERARMRQVSMGLVPNPDAIADGIVYVALQELATRISHRNTGKMLDDPQGTRDHEPGRRRREPAPPLLPRPRVGGARDRPVGHGRRDRPPGAHFEMPGAGIADFKAPRHAHRRRRRLRLRRRTTTRSWCRWCSSTGGSSSCRT